MKRKPDSEMQDDAERTWPASSEQRRTSKRRMPGEARTIAHANEKPILRLENVDEESQTPEATDTGIKEAHRPNPNHIHADNKTTIMTATKDNPENSQQDTNDLARKMMQTLAEYAKQPQFQHLSPEIRAHCLNARNALRSSTMQPSDGSDFLKLPPELRQKIYRYCYLKPKSEKIYYCQLRKHVRGPYNCHPLPVPNSLHLVYPDRSVQKHLLSYMGEHVRIRLGRHPLFHQWRPIPQHPAISAAIHLNSKSTTIEKITID